MITLDIYNAKTFFDGPSAQIEIMFEALRVEDKRAFWKAKATIRAMEQRGAFDDMTKEEKEEEIEKIKENAKWIKFYDKRNSSFGTGLVGRVKKLLKREGVKFKAHDARTKLNISGYNVKEFPIKGLEQRAEQIEALVSALDEQKGVLHMATNAGKTEVAAAIIIESLKKAHILRVLYLVHRKQLAVQTLKRFQNHLGDSIPITMIGAGLKKVSDRGVLVATVQTANNLMGRVAFKRFLEKCHILFVDEFHINKAWQASRIAYRCAAPMRFGLSGTIDKKNKVKWMHYKAMTGPIISEIRNEELVKLGRSAKPFIRMIEVKDTVIGGSYAQAYRYGVVRSRRRNRLVVREILRYVRKNYRTLVTVSRLSHGRNLLSRVERKADIPVAFISGSTPLHAREKIIKKFENGKIPVLIASQIIDVGMDIPKIEAVVFAGGGLGWELVLQRLGRVLRRKKGENRVYVSDFIDLHNEYLLKHSLERLKYYDRENIAEIKVVTP